jgi:hypothetical protein
MVPDGSIVGRVPIARGAPGLVFVETWDDNITQSLTTTQNRLIFVGLKFWAQPKNYWRFLRSRRWGGSLKHCEVKVRRAALIIALLIANPSFGQAQSHLQVPASILPLAELTASDGGGYDYFGFSVSVSGNTAVIGAPMAHSQQHGQQGPGLAYLFIKPASGWGDMTQTAELSASDGQAEDLFGYSVSVSGNVVVVGAPFANNAEGAVYLFVKPAGGWKNMTETLKLTASDGQPNIQLGFSVGVNGNTVVAGAPGYFFPSYPGAAYVFTKPNNDWSSVHETAKLTASDGQGDGQFGFSICISGDTMAVGAIGIGSAYVFVEPPGGWVTTTETAKLISSDDGLGFSTSVSSDRSTIAVGSPFADNLAGAVYVFVKPVGGWVNSTESAKLSTSENNFSVFGYSVGTNGNLVLGGAPENSNGGQVYGFLRPVSGWTTSSTPNFQVFNPDSSGGNFGFALNLNAGTAVIGADYAGGGNGAAFVYGKSN